MFGGHMLSCLTSFLVQSIYMLTFQPSNGADLHNASNIHNKKKNTRQTFFLIEVFDGLLHHMLIASFICKRLNFLNISGLTIKERKSLDSTTKVLHSNFRFIRKLLENTRLWKSTHKH